MNKKSVFSTILTVIAIYLLFDLVFWKGFLYHFLEAFFKSAAQQGKIGLVAGLMGLAIGVFGLISIVLGMSGRTIFGKVPPERITAHKITTGVIGSLLTAAGFWLCYYGFTANR